MMQSKIESSSSHTSNSAGIQTLAKTLTWKNAFWLTCSVPLATFINIGGVSSLSGSATWMVFTISVIIGFIQAFAYAELGALYPEKAGGVSVIASVAWRRYNGFLGAIPIWAYLMAWMTCVPVCAGLTATFIMQLFPADSAFASWSLVLLDLNFLMPDMTIRIDGTWLIALLLMAAVLLIQLGGAKLVAKVQNILCGVSLAFLLLVAILPLVTGKVSLSNVFPVAPVTGTWDIEGIVLLFAAFAVAGFITYAFETSVCYVSEFKNPKTDTMKAIISSATLGLVLFFLLTVSFQGYVGLEGLMDPDIQSGVAVGPVMAEMIGGGQTAYLVAYVFLLILSFSTIVTPLGGSSRTVFQAAHDGILPMALGKANAKGAPSAGIVAVVVFSAIVLMFSNYFFLLSAVTICYMVFHFFALNSVWILRSDVPDRDRPMKIPRLVLGICIAISLLDIAFLAGYPFALGWGVFICGVVCCLIIVPLFWYRHYVKDKGIYPGEAYLDLGLQPGAPIVRGRAGWKPELMLLAAVVLLAALMLLFAALL